MSRAAGASAGERPVSEGPVVVIVGPTAVGKSELAVAVAEWCGGEVVSADAFQVYRGLDIGTAKVADDVQARVPHHCIDVADPDEHYTAGRYAREAAAAIAGVHQRGRTAVVAGGSGLYVRALIDGLAPLPRRDPALRRALGAVEERRGLAHIHAMARALDPDWADAVGPADRQRLLRGVEVTLRSGRPMSALLDRRGWTGPHYDPAWIGLTLPRPTLYAQIESRVERMLEVGWLDEVRDLVDAGYADAPALRAIGYRELVAHLRGELSLDAARAQLVRATRRYAKRQLTWFRGQTPAPWLELDDAGPEARGRLARRVRRRLSRVLTCYPRVASDLN